MKEINSNSIKSVMINLYFNDKLLSSGTGFIMCNHKTEYFLITNRHNFTGRNNFDNECLDESKAIPNKVEFSYAYTDTNKIKWKKIEVELYDDDDDKPNWIEHHKLKNKVDVVAIKFKCEVRPKGAYYPMRPYQLKITDQLYILGFPFGKIINQNEGNIAIWTSGSVASEPNINMLIKDEELPVFLVDAKTRQGQSGSPVIYYSARGYVRYEGGYAEFGSEITHLVGIYSGRINSNSDLGFVWKYEIIEEIIEQ